MTTAASLTDDCAGLSRRDPCGPCRSSGFVRPHRSQAPVARHLLAVTGHPMTTRRAPRRTLADGVAHRLASPCDSRAEARKPKPPRAPRSVAPAEACSTLAERGLPGFTRAEARSRPAKPTPHDPRDQRPRLSRSACSVTPRGRNHTVLAEPPHQFARPKPRGLTEPDPRSHRRPKSAPRSTDRRRQSPQPKSPWAAHNLLDQPA